MPLSFCIVGVLNIFILFFAPYKKLKKLLLSLGLVFVLLGYFVEPSFFEKSSINMCILVGVFLSLFSMLIYKSGKSVAKPLLFSFVLVSIYLLVCVKDYNYLLYFNLYFLTILINVMSLFVRGIESKFVFVLMAYLLCEIGSFFVVGDRLSFYPLFSPESLFGVLVPVVFTLFVGGVEKLFIKIKGEVSKNA